MRIEPCNSRFHPASIVTIVVLSLAPVFVNCLLKSFEIGKASTEQQVSHAEKNPLNRVLIHNPNNWTPYDSREADWHPLILKEVIPSFADRSEKFAPKNQFAKRSNTQQERYSQDVPVTDSHYPLYFDLVVKADLDGLQMHCTALDSFEGRVAITNLLGKELLNKEITFVKGTYLLEYNTRHLKKGHYLVHFYNDGYNLTKKVFVDQPKTEILTYYNP